MTAVAQEEDVDFGVPGELYQAVRGMADPLLRIDLNAMLSGLEIRLAAELFEQLIGVLAFLVGFTGCAWVARKLLDENDR